MTFQAFEYTTHVGAQDHVLNDHRVHGVRIMPGVTFLDIFTSLLSAERHAPGQVEFRDILFRSPVSVDESLRRELKLALKPEGDGARLIAESRALDDKDQAWTEHCTARILSAAPEDGGRIDVAALRAAAHRSMPLDDVYARARSLDIVHGPYMRCEGEAWLADDFLLARIELSTAGQGGLDAHLLHPAYLDSATLVPFAASGFGYQSDHPFIPICIDRVQIFGVPRGRCWVMVTVPRGRALSEDLVHNDLSIVDDSGAVLLRIEGLTAKRIRSPELITRLLERGAGAAAKPQAAGPGDAGASPRTAAVRWLSARIAALLGGVIPDPKSGFYDLGLDSSRLLELAAELEDALATRLYPTLLFEHNTIERLADWLAGHHAPSLQRLAGGTPADTPEAIPVAKCDGQNDSKQRIRSWLLARLASMLDSKPIDICAGFYELGLDSAQLLQLSAELEQALSARLYPTLLFEYDTVDRLTEWLARHHGAVAAGLETETPVAPRTGNETAAVELAVYFPAWKAWQATSSSRYSGPLLLYIEGSAAEEWITSLADLMSVQGLTVVTPGSAYAQRDERVFSVRPDCREDWDRIPDLPERAVVVLENGKPAQVRFAETLVLIQSLLGRHEAPVLVMAGADEPVNHALAGLLRTAVQEHPRFSARLHLDSTLEVGQIDRLLVALDGSPVGFEVLRYALGSVEQAKVSRGALSAPWQVDDDQGPWLITGAGGGLAPIFTAALVECGVRAFVWVSRRSLPTSALEFAQKLRERGIEVVCLQADVTADADVKRVWHQAKQRFGRIAGILHSAGANDDAMLLQKNAGSAARVLSPKIDGARLLDDVSREESLSHFVLCSSIAGLLGNIGQCDYAYANAYLDAFAEWRNAERAAGRRSGRTLSVNWPLWKDGGMQIDATIEKVLSRHTGLTPLATSQGMHAFKALLAADQPRALVVAGALGRFENHLGDFLAMSAKAHAATKNGLTVDDAVAIVGLAGRYPHADDLDAFWNNLLQGHDAIDEIPASRWTVETHFDADRNRRGKSYSKWGGFLNDVDRFDAAFFGITPREAAMIDPQERLMLETAWHAFEDAGYTRERLNGRRVGVYVGVMWGHYQLYGAPFIGHEQSQLPGAVFSSIANRISYWFNLTGPSMAVDTMCSSSLTALHLACEALERGDIDMAVVGGVNLSLHPAKYQFLCQSQMLSPDGRCRAFGEEAGGYVPGEGVGVIVLKARSRAEAEGDRIHALVRATALNHGGRSSGYTVPNPWAQAEVIRAALARANRQAGDISYIEAHGTGTALGDPIEIAGLKTAWDDALSPDRPCAIGSLKSNIGHLESAAGIAALTKVVLQLKHRTLVPSLHAERLNQNIDWRNAGFVVQKSCTPWSAGAPRLAGVSAFGAGGSNAHVILEEYVPASLPDVPDENVLLLSARTEDALRSLAERYLSLLTRHDVRDPLPRWTDIAYTSRMAREAFYHRIAVVAVSREQAGRQLEAFLQRGRADGVYTKDSPLSGHDLGVVAARWAHGETVAWPATIPLGRIVSLPGYPFVGDRHWAPLGEPRAAIALGASDVLAQENISNLDGVRFHSVLPHDSSLFADHIINERPLLPGLAMMQMMVSACELSEKRPVTEVRDLTWALPVVAGQTPVGLTTALYRDGEAVLAEVLCGEDVHCQARLVFDPQPVPQPTAAQALLEEAAEHLSGSIFYQRFERKGVRYGAAFRSVEEVRIGTDYAICSLAAPEKAGQLAHIALIDGGLQTVTALLPGFQQPEVRYLPYSIRRVRRFGGSGRPRHAIVTRAQEPALDKGMQRFDIRIVDEVGQTVVAIEGFALRRVMSGEGQSLLFYKRAWRHESTLADAPSIRSLLLFSDDPALQSAFADRIDGPVLRVSAAAGFAWAADNHVCLNPADDAHFQQLDRDLKARGMHFSYVVNAWACDASQPTIEGSLQRGILALFRFTQNMLLRGEAFTLFHAYPLTADTALHASVAGWGRAVHEEEPQLCIKAVGIEPGQDMVSCLIAEVVESDRLEAAVRYRADGRYVHRLEKLEMEIAPAKPPYRADGVYLITGGAGGLGVLVAEHIARSVAARVILNGRSPANERIEGHLQRIRALGATIEYMQADVTDANAVQAMIAGIVKRYGRISGIFHGAGVLRDGLLRNKTIDDMRQVMAAKVMGTLNIERAVAGMDLDFIQLSSSISGILGNPGQSDYGYPNCFMDYFAEERMERCARGEAAGLTVSINWPLWRKGGMKLDAETEAWLLENTGMVALQVEDGLSIVDEALRIQRAGFLVINGYAAKVQKWMRRHLHGEVAGSRIPSPVERGTLLKLTVARLIEWLADETRLSRDSIDPDMAFQAYGIDSIVVINLTHRLEACLGTLSKSLFFEYPSVVSLAAYLVDNHAGGLAVLHGLAEQQAPKAQPPAAPTESEPEKQLASFALRQCSAQGQAAFDDSLVIVGVSGRYPGARDIDSFWENLRAGRDCITEVPAERWDWRRYFDADKQASGRIYARWGGFIEDADKFDPLLFGMTPQDAMITDPQERLFLQTVWHTLEDAGYSRSALDGASIGVFVGVMWGQYQLFSNEAVLAGKSRAASSIASSVANRVSYTFNWSGPSLAMDTMCSSSLSSLHFACEAIRRGECEAAVAGGVNLSLHPNKYLQLAQGKFLSTDGRCRSFGAGGDGYVPGEGVGAVLIKRLSHAHRDGDRIYAVVRATAMNNDGRSNSYTAPNPNAQAAVIRSAMARAGVRPGDISYIEAHGSGTALGDPIEISGLVSAFGGRRDKPSFHCALGSVKSNIGHLESAAGIAALTKVLLQLRHGELAPSLHSSILNPNMSLDGTPFHVVQEAQPWHCPQGPRRAGISSFGAGGTNVHVILEEYVAPAKPTAANVPPQLFVLSASTEAQLADYARNWAEWLSGPGAATPIESIAITAQLGREPLEERLAVAFSSAAELCETLRNVAGGLRAASAVRGTVRRGHNPLRRLLDGDEGKQFLDLLICERNLAKLGELWCNGIAIDWRALAGNTPVQRCSLPLYPFASESYLIDPRLDFTDRIAPLHPLLSRNVSTFQEQAFETELAPYSVWFADHVIRGKAILPGAAIMEMLLAAANAAIGGGVSSVHTLQWLAPAVSGTNGLRLRTVLNPDADGIAAEVSMVDAGGVSQRVAAARLGSARHGMPSLPPDLVARKQAAPAVDGGSFYAAFASDGFQYGPALRGIRFMHTAADGVLIELDHESAGAADAGFTLPPRLVDAAFQSTRQWLASHGQAYVPAEIEDFEFIDGSEKPIYAWLRPLAASSGGTDDQASFSVSWLAADGRVVWHLHRLSLRAVAAAHSLVCYERELQTSPFRGEAVAAPTIVLTVEADLDSGAVCQIVPASAYAWLADCTVSLDPSKPDHFDRLLDDLDAKGWTFERIIHRWADAPHADLVTAQRFGVYSLFHLTQALMRRKRACPLLFVYPQRDIAPAVHAAYAACASWIRVLREENPSYRYRAVACIGKPGWDRLHAEFSAPDAASVRLDEEYGRWAEAAVERALPPSSGKLLPEGGVALITGGLGGIGRVLARHLAERYRARLVLTGRSVPNDRLNVEMDALRALGSEAVYWRADIADEKDAERLARKLRKRFGELDLVLHAAGVTRDDFIMRKAAADMAEVFAPKVQGTLNLHRNTLDFAPKGFVLFSSVSGFMGNPGQSDYAYANDFMNAFAVWRNENCGRTVSINWPLWRDVGMQLPAETQAQIFAATGMEAMPQEQALAVLDRALAGTAATVLPLNGDAGRIARWISRQEDRAATLPAVLPVRADATCAAASPVAMPAAQSSGAQNLPHSLREMLSRHSGIAADRIDLDTEFEYYGIGSVIIGAMNAELESRFGALPKTLFFEYRTLRGICEFIEAELTRRTPATDPAQAVQRGTAGDTAFVHEDVVRWLGAMVARHISIPVERIDPYAELEQYVVSSVVIGALNAELEASLGELPKTLFSEFPQIAAMAEHLWVTKQAELRKALGGKQDTPAVPIPAGPAVRASLLPPPTVALAAALRNNRFASSRNSGAIAVVGLAGRFPQAEDLDQFWHNLKTGVDCIETVPPSRWDAESLYSADRSAAGRSFTKWGGFLRDHDCFDATFFGISKPEAVSMDPQERLFLEASWHCLEDAGLTPQQLAKGRTAVYAGAMWGQYQLVGHDAWRDGQAASIATSLFASIANRVSYLYNWRGPSLTLDTMCSSSLTALKLAVDALRQGDIDAALVGGVNLTLHPNKYLQLSTGGFMASDGRCRAFGAGGDGYVPGEGVGCVLLKTLDQALADGDPIRAVIRGIAVNHGGKTNGYTVPNPRAQGEVVARALADAGIDADSVSYIEAHGTGTALGDPIEIVGLSQAYGFDRPQRPRCAIGSVKAGIGHLEAAAGMAGLAKIVLQLEHGELVPSLHATPPNPNIDFSRLALDVQTRLAPWKTDGRQPRRAALSSFGAGGTNVHVVLEEAPWRTRRTVQLHRCVFPLSAKDRAGLVRQAVHWRSMAKEWATAAGAPQPADCAYTLQVGRTAMKERLAIVAASYGELAGKLDAWLKGDGEVGIGLDTTERVAREWAQGKQVDWLSLYDDNPPQRVSLPGYRFARDRHWVPTSGRAAALPAVAAATAPEAAPARAGAALRDRVASVLAEVLMLDALALGGEERFDELGMDSVLAGRCCERLNQALGVELQPTVFYNYPCLDALAEHIDAQSPLPASETTASAGAADEAVAVIGMSGRFPGAPDLDAFWRNLRDGVDSVKEVPRERWDMSALYDARPQQSGKSYSKWMGILDDIDRFDAQFFGLMPMEALAMDPQHRIALEESWKAMEHAGYAPEHLTSSSCGVFMGAMASDYMDLLREAGEDGNAFAMLGTHMAVLAGRISYLMNLKGPALTLDTACSSSLLAVHLACKSILDGECDMALAGGVFLALTPSVQVLSSAAGMLSKEGHCKTFDNSADGIVIGEGAGVVVLKRLSAAIADGDTIYGVIRASGANQDGKTNGMTAPNGMSQAELEARIYRTADIDPATIGYVEAHGTGTKLGDPIEVEGVTQAFRRFTDETQFCAIGSVKPNIGHCYAAAGIASLIKTLLSLKHRQLPPSLHCVEENEHICFERTPFFVNKTLRPWLAHAGEPLRAAVSAFGYSGTNVHLVVDEAPTMPAVRRKPSEAGRWLLLSAKHRNGLTQYARSLAEHLAQVQPELEDVAYTLQVGRAQHAHRLALRADDLPAAVAALNAYLSGTGEGSLWQAREIARRSERPKSDAVAAALSKGDWQAAISAWMAGGAADWRLAYKHTQRPWRIALPGHPLAASRFWPQAKSPAEKAPAAVSSELRKLNLQEMRWLLAQAPEPAGLKRIDPADITVHSI